MKKISILMLIASVAMVSCGNTYEAKQPQLANMNDSVNYYLGFTNGAQMKMQALRGTLDEKELKVACTEFVDALSKAYEKKETEEPTQAQAVGTDIGYNLKNFETTGLAGNKVWGVNEKLMLQGLVNALYGDTTGMDEQEAGEYFQTKFQESRYLDQPEKAPKAVKASCPKKAKEVKLVTENDSLNYAFGVINGGQLRMYVLSMDTLGEQRAELIAAINKAMKEDVHYPQLVNSAKQIGAAIREQESEGLIGVAELTTDFELIKQGFVNGFLVSEEDSVLYINPREANQYINAAISELRFGNKKQEGAEFLAQNKLREGVIETESGLQYEVLVAGKGPKPTAADKVRVHYVGTLTDGSKFDSSYDRNMPAEFGVTQVIKGWTEALQLMPVGSKYKLYIPYQLGYGEQGAGQNIPPYATLIFEVELLEILK